MPEMKENAASRQMKILHGGRVTQFWISFGKMLRMFVYQNDWKVLPMAALIAGLVGMVVRNMEFLGMEANLMGSFALVMMCIWNGCFNSIQVICRERDVIKREHRSGMHISSYVVSHMLYQALLCLLQTGVAVYVTKIVGVKYPSQGLFTKWLIVDFGITMFLITYASDMMALWVSSLARNTTVAMTVMPFLLIFQLIFSGGMLQLPEWGEPITDYTISGQGFRAIMAQSNYNSLPMAMLWNKVYALWDKEITATVTLGQALDYLGNEQNNKDIAEFREKKLTDLIPEEEKAKWDDAQTTEENSVTIGELIDEIAADPLVQENRDKSYTVNTTVGRIIRLIGADKVRNTLLYGLRDSDVDNEYSNTKENIAGYWMNLVGFAVVFAALAVVTLEFIDKDKR